MEQEHRRIYILLLILMYVSMLSKKKNEKQKNNVKQKNLFQSSKQFTTDFITGEKIQEMCHVYLGKKFDLDRNPYFKTNYHNQKKIEVQNLKQSWDNPRLVFCYSNSLDEFMEKMHFLENKFILISHNEDNNITEKYLPLLNNPKLVHWFGQNAMVHHNKLSLLPIGIANSMWKHGNVNLIQYQREKHVEKIKEDENAILFNFDVRTNINERMACKDSLIKKGLKFIPFLENEYYLEILSKSKYVVNPPGNGIDCHRIWEGYLLNSIPILLKNVFTDRLQQELELPCISLSTWNDFSLDVLKSQTDRNVNQQKLYNHTYKRKIYEKLALMNEDLKMNVVYSFHGKLPPYALTTVQQLRKFFKGDVYFILDDVQNNIVNIMRDDYRVNIIPLEKVFDHNFKSIVNYNRKKFSIVNFLKGRENLFEYTFERFYLVNNLMKINSSLTNVFFLELDNLIYDDPTKWLSMFSTKEMGYMFDNIGRYSSGIFYVKHQKAMQVLIDFFNNYIKNTSTNFINEMSALNDFHYYNKDLVQVFPTHWESDLYPKETWENYSLYGKSIFDAAAVGIFLGGADVHNTNGKVVKNKIKWHYSLIDYSIYKYEWRLDSENRKRPFVQNPNTGDWILLNNLHIHSKDLETNMS